VRVYVDSSVLLRVILGEPNPLAEWSRITDAVSSEITRVEGLRVLDRLRLAGELVDRELARRRQSLLETLSGFELVRLNRSVLDRAADPFPTQIRTLDALHLASAVLARGRFPALRFATHDDHLGTAATALNFQVLGLT
jgi:predicted nucleic acid-binding protein